MMQGLHTSFKKIFHRDTPIKVKPGCTPSHYTCQSVPPAENVKINVKLVCIYTQGKSREAERQNVCYSHSLSSHLTLKISIFNHRLCLYFWNGHIWNHHIQTAPPNLKPIQSAHDSNVSKTGLGTFSCVTASKIVRFCIAWPTLPMSYRFSEQLHFWKYCTPTFLPPFLGLSY